MRFLGLDTFKLDAKQLMQLVPPPRPGLAYTLPLIKYRVLGRHGRQETEAHCDTVVIIAMYRTPRLLDIFTSSIDLNPIIQLSAYHAKLRKFVMHSFDSIALFLPLVCNTYYTRRSTVLAWLGNSSEY